jgi:hypothetical protein
MQHARRESLNPAAAHRGLFQRGRRPAKICDITELGRALAVFERHSPQFAANTLLLAAGGDADSGVFSRRFAQIGRAF